MNRRSRVSPEQRQQMLQFMMQHPDFARGRVTGADAARRRVNLINELASVLNSTGVGATKTPEKWWKCWQDWRSDTKSKALRINKSRNQTGGGPGPSPLSELEENLLQFCGVEMVHGLEGVPDPLEQADQNEAQTTQDIRQETSEPPLLESTVEVEEVSQERAPPKRDSFEQSLERQAAALDRMANGIESLAINIQAGFESLAQALLAIAAAVKPEH